MWLLALFIAVPLIEIALFIQVGGWLTLWPTLAIVVATALVGTALVRRQGRQVIEELRGSIGELRDPAAPLAHGAMILFSGALLLTPGFLTDAVGFALLVPRVREAIFGLIVRNLTVTGAGRGDPGQSGTSRAEPGPMDFPSGGRATARGDVIDGDYEVRDDHESAGSRPPSAWTRH